MATTNDNNSTLSPSPRDYHPGTRAFSRLLLQTPANSSEKNNGEAKKKKSTKRGSVVKFLMAGPDIIGSSQVQDFSTLFPKRQEQSEEERVASAISLFSDCSNKTLKTSNMRSDTHEASESLDALSTVEVKTRRWGLKTYKQCFLGSDAVDLLVSSGCAVTRDDAVRIGRKVSEEYDLFHHVKGEHPFKDGLLYYRFNPIVSPKKSS